MKTVCSSVIISRDNDTWLVTTYNENQIFPDNKILAVPIKTDAITYTGLLLILKLYTSGRCIITKIPRWENIKLKYMVEYGTPYYGKYSAYEMLHWKMQGNKTSEERVQVDKLQVKNWIRKYREKKIIKHNKDILFKKFPFKQN